MAYIEHDGKKHNVPSGMSEKDIFASMQTALPELANAKLEKDGENFKVNLNLGKKG